MADLLKDFEDKAACKYQDHQMQEAFEYCRDQLRALLPTAPPAETASDAAYAERNQLVAFLSRCYPSGTRKTAIEGWDPEWHGCVFIDTPEGQMSWHYHDREAHLFAALPAYEKPWDGHTTAEKYERLAKLAPPAETAELEALKEAARSYAKCRNAQNRDCITIKALALVEAEREAAGGGKL